MYVSLYVSTFLFNPFLFIPERMESPIRRVFEAVGLRLMTEYSIHVLIVCHRGSHITGLTTGLVPRVAFLMSL